MCYALRLNCGECLKQEARAIWGFPNSSAVKNLPAMRETRIQSLGWENFLRKLFSLIVKDEYKVD